MSKSSGKAKANKVNMLEDKSGKNTRALESKKKDMENNEFKMGTHVGPSVGVSVTRKKFVTKMKSLKKRHLDLGPGHGCNSATDATFFVFLSDFTDSGTGSLSESKFAFIDLDEVKILLLAHELRLNKFKKSPTSNLVYLNLAQANSSPTTSEDVHFVSVESSPTKFPAPNVEHEFTQFYGARHSHGGWFGRGRGRYSNSHIQCQHQWTNRTFGYDAFPTIVWTRPPMKSRNMASLSISPSAFVSNSLPISSTSWFPDSRASFHVANDAIISKI
ncbi:hypothetical protein KIW84_063409 [Lathyrus oleraceus]|uniref:Uncharacterized protein n=1 Tax=Pisum sativum TaxID=3888 RepID=A0A9D4W9R1_PEA|nr:hypothetical protein KIW84_063409 [Pisum sativum]